MPGLKKGFFLVHFPEECFPTVWIESSVMVIFDFQGTLPTDSQDLMRNTLWCLLPGRAKRRAVVIAISRQDFVTMKHPRLLPDPAHEIVSAFDKLLKEQEEILGQQTQMLGWKPRRRAIIPRRHSE